MPVSSRLADYYRDTEPKALEVFLALQRKMTGPEKIAAVFQMNEMLWGLAESNVRQQYPQARDPEVFLRTASRFHDRETMKRVYGWAPDRALQD
jgi:hypothetical protein